VGNMRNYKVGDHLQVKLPGGRIVQATIKAILETMEGLRLQVSFGSEAARTAIVKYAERT
jgi:hypothetical protein